MALILMYCQYIKTRDSQAIVAAQIFLRDIEHHFIPTRRPKFISHAFRYLTRFFKVYPNVSVEQSQRAIEMVEKIYEAMGMKLKKQSHYQLQLSVEEQMRRQIKESVHEVFSPIVECAA